MDRVSLDSVQTSDPHDREDRFLLGMLLTNCTNDCCTFATLFASKPHIGTEYFECTT